MNEAVIWNDHAPINAKEIVSLAHEYGIKVVWGYAWGWTTDCKKTLAEYSDEKREELKRGIIEVYENEYADTGADGIYFQTFTETETETANGRSVAEIAVELVNGAAAALLEKHPELHVQFGLHATSVKTRLDVIKNVDPRVYIVWEDCGAFPFNYYPEKTENFDETCSFTEKLLSLRGKNEKFGAVLKGTYKLDWTAFRHIAGRYILGERTENFIRGRREEKRELKRYIEARWKSNADYARKLIRLIAEKNKDGIIEFLYEDGLLEDEICPSIAFCAAALWTPDVKTEELLEKAEKLK
ncbi:MAG: hypothetical protein J5903_03800 [Clostridia bacterium]|nr:hypothetical protein [Clostridia bacterium]